MTEERLSKATELMGMVKSLEKEIEDLHKIERGSGVVFCPSFLNDSIRRRIDQYNDQIFAELKYAMMDYQKDFEKL